MEIPHDICPPHLLKKLQTQNISTCTDLLNCTYLDLMELLDIPYSKAVELLDSVSRQVAPAFTTALQIYQNALDSVQRPLFTSFPSLDSALRYGLPAGSITELVGPAGVGKSQFCFHMALRAAAPIACGGLGLHVMYIDTERKFSSKRLADIAGNLWPEQLSRPEAMDELLQRILLITPNDMGELRRTIEALDSALSRYGGGLVILDSIAAVARVEMDVQTSAGLFERQEVLGLIAVRLKALAEQFRIPVLVTNQVSARMAPTPTSRDNRALTRGEPQDSSGLAAALGTKWAHFVNVRLILERSGQIRRLKVAKSPVSANVVFQYVIGPRGVEEVEGTTEVVQQDVLDMNIVNEPDFGTMVIQS